MSKTMTRKGYGRIYCKHFDDIAKIKGIIFQMDENEFRYLPSNLITTFDAYPTVVYTGKFDELDLNELSAICFDRNIPIFIFDSGHFEYPENILTKFPK